MKNYYIVSAVVILLFNGCSSKSHFYQLHPKIKQTKQVQTKYFRQKVIGIAEVSIPEYLDKPQIVTRLSPGKLSLNESERWIGTFDKNIQSVIAKDLAMMLPHYTFLSKPWDEPLEEHYRIYVHITRFDGDIKNGNVVLEGNWRLVDTENGHFVKGEEIHLERHSAVTLDDIVETQSKLLEELSKHIAHKLKRYL